MSKKTYCYYIDESGHINNDSNVFLYGCIKLDTPDLSDTRINKLRNELKDDIDFYEYIDQLEKGFHACDNTFDIKTQFYRILPLLNFRAYFEVIYKNSKYFKTLKSDKSDFEIISKMLENLIKRMILQNKKDKHLFFIEELEVQGKSLKKILEDLYNKYGSNFDIDFKIVTKGDNNVSITDYINHNLSKLFDETDDKKFYAKANIKIIERFNKLKDKIALIHLWNNDSFFSRKGNDEETVEIANLRKILTEA